MKDVYTLDSSTVGLATCSGCASRPLSTCADPNGTRRSFWIRNNLRAATKRSAWVL